MRLPALILFLLSSSFVGAQITSPRVPSDEPPLATLTAHPDKTVFNLGEEIRVTLILRAGPHGAYVSKASICAPPRKITGAAATWATPQGSMFRYTR